jgi:(p)ppGpp synthase/HD superfamily hydrolase
MHLDWKPKGEKAYPTHLNILVVDRVGVVKDILTKVADAGVNISDFKVKERPDDNSASLKMILNVSGQEQLNQIIVSIKNMTDVLVVERV